jgi:hypothetical protein
MAKGLSRENLIALAREGAQARMEALRAELASLEALFGGTGARRGRKPGSRAAAAPKRRRRKMSKEARKRISDAQKKRWAEQRAKGPKK